MPRGSVIWLRWVQNSGHSAVPAVGGRFVTEQMNSGNSGSRRRVATVSRLAERLNQAAPAATPPKGHTTARPVFSNTSAGHKKYFFLAIADPRKLAGDRSGEPSRKAKGAEAHSRDTS